MSADVGNRIDRVLSMLTPRLVGLVGLLLVGYIVFGLLAGNNWNPTVFIKFPEANAPILGYAEERFDEVIVAGDEGHDGKYFFIQAVDPFFVDPETNAFLLDRPTYRAQRMLYPTLAGGFGLFGSAGTAWGLIVLNVLGVGAGTYLTARVAERLGLSALFGLAFFVNPSVFVSSVIDTAEVLAMVFLMWGILEVMERRVGHAAAMFTFAALSRETMLLCVAGWVVYELLRHKRVKWVMAAPFAASAAWWLYVRLRIGYLSPEVQDVSALGAPLDGLLDSFPGWLGESALRNDFVIATVLTVASAALIYWSIARRSLIPLMGAGFALVAVLMVEEVWLHYFDSTRALTPVVTFLFLALPFTIRPHPEGFV